MLKRWPLMAVLVVACALVVAGCGDDGSGSGGSASGPNTITDGELRVGSDIPYPPFEFGRAPDYEGFDVDIVNEIAKGLDVEAKLVKSPFDPILRNLAQNRFDMVASAVTVTPERERTVDFSEPYLPADQSLMVKRGSEIKTVEDLKGKTVGAQVGTTGAGYAKNKADAAAVRTYDLIDDAFKALQAGQIEAVIHDFPISKYAERSKKDLVVVQTIETGDDYGLAFAKENTVLRDRVNRELRAMKEGGTYTKIYRKWFQEDPPDSIFKTGGSGSG